MFQSSTSKVVHALMLFAKEQRQFLQKSHIILQVDTFLWLSKAITGPLRCAAMFIVLFAFVS